MHEKHPTIRPSFYPRFVQICDFGNKNPNFLNRPTLGAEVTLGGLCTQIPLFAHKLWYRRLNRTKFEGCVARLFDGAFLGFKALGVARSGDSVEIESTLN